MAFNDNNYNNPHHTFEQHRAVSVKKVLNKSEGNVSLTNNTNTNKRNILIPYNSQFNNRIRNKKNVSLNDKHYQTKTNPFQFYKIKGNQRKIEGSLIETNPKENIILSSPIIISYNNKSKSISNNQSFHSRNKANCFKAVGSTDRINKDIFHPKSHFKTSTKTSSSKDNTIMAQFIQSQMKSKRKNNSIESISSNTNFVQSIHLKSDKNVFNSSRNQSRNGNIRTIKKKNSFYLYKNHLTKLPKQNKKSITPLFESRLRLMKKNSNHYNKTNHSFKSSHSSNSGNKAILTKLINKNYIKSYPDSFSQSINSITKNNQLFFKGKRIKYTHTLHHKSNNNTNIKYDNNNKQKTTVIDLIINQDNDNFLGEVSTNATINYNLNNNNLHTNYNELTQITQVNNHHNPFSITDHKSNNDVSENVNSNYEKTIKRIHEYSRKGLSKYEEKKYNQDASVIIHNFTNYSKNLFIAVL